MSISSIEKRQVTNSWLERFPQLTAYTKVKLYKILGPNIIGIEIIKLPRTDEYRPHFVIYPLWKVDENKCLETPVVIKDIKRKDGFQLDIPYKDNEKWKNEAFDCTSNQVISLNEDVTIDDLFELIADVLKTGRRGPIPEANAFETKLFTSVYLGDWKRTEKILDELSEVGPTWPPFGFDFIYGPFDQWYKSLEEKVRNRDLFMNQISKNSESAKLSKLKRSELVP
ncbi:hypothetical protein [Chitinophaga sp. RAB17]|uniref:hypothetical protein n=1 Tax=Chitinophaga sp. RAB17 TaxID=3233049 RepID=UPI003F929190